MGRYSEGGKGEREAVSDKVMLGSVQILVVVSVEERILVLF